MHDRGADRAEVHPGESAAPVSTHHQLGGLGPLDQMAGRSDRTVMQAGHSVDALATAPPPFTTESEL